VTPGAAEPRGIRAEYNPFCQGRPDLVAVARPRIEADLRRVVTAIHRKGRKVDAIVLTGSVGRGEGALWEENGQTVLLSDYDLFVFTGETLPSAFFRDLEPSLAHTLWAPKATIGALATDELPKLPAALWTYDLRHGSRVLEGDPALLERVPAFQPTEIPAWEGLKLLCNYAGVLLRAPRPDGAPDRPDALVLCQALVRLAQRIGDALAIREGCYHHLLALRPATLVGLASFRALPPKESELILWGCREKLIPREFLDRDILEVTRHLFPLLERVLQESLSRYLDLAAEELPVLLTAYRRRHRVPLSWKGHLLAGMTRLWRGDPHGLPWRALPTEPFHHVLTTVPLVLLSTPGVLHRPAYLREARCLLGDAATWQACREKVLRLWAAICLGEGDAQ
jgi:hypothetical protein